jgi:hypothetical protein
MADKRKHEGTASHTSSAKTAVTATTTHTETEQPLPGTTLEKPPIPLTAEEPLLREFIEFSSNTLNRIEVQLVTFDPTSFSKETMTSIVQGFCNLASESKPLHLRDIEVTAQDAAGFLNLFAKGTLQLDEKVMEVLLATVRSLRRMTSLVRLALENSRLLTRSSDVDTLRQLFQQVRAQQSLKKGKGCGCSDCGCHG